MTLERRIKLDPLRTELNSTALAASISSFVRMRQLFTSLEEYCLKRSAALRGSGFLATMIKVTARAAKSIYPLDPKDFKTKGGGQVKAAPNRSVDRILGDWGFDRNLGSEAGRTSRATIGYMEEYVDVLNTIYSMYGAIDHSMLMLFWMKKVRNYFQATPIDLKVPSGRTLRHLIRSVIAAVRKREREVVGRTIMGTVLQHLVGAKLEIVLDGSSADVAHYKANQSDVQTGRSGDFLVRDCALHVTTSPTEALVRKCVENLEAGLSPIIITLPEKARAAEVMTENAGREDEIEILDFEPFMATNLLEMSLFDSKRRRPRAAELIGRYNRIIEDVEQDPGLKIEFEA